MQKVIRLMLFLFCATFCASAQMYNCPLPTIQDVNPVVPSTHTNCVLPVGAIKIASDGDVVTVYKVAAPVHFIYCTGSDAAIICNPPFMYSLDLNGVGPWKRFGGPPIPGKVSVGDLYLIPGVRDVTLGIKRKGTDVYIAKWYDAAKN